jgi:hypothetical protein
MSALHEIAAASKEIEELRKDGDKRLLFVYTQVIKKEPVPGAFKMTFEQWLASIDAAIDAATRKLKVQP